MPSNSSTSTRTYRSQNHKDEDPAPIKPSRWPSANRLPWVLVVFLAVAVGLLFWQYRQAQNKIGGVNQTNIKYQQRLQKLILLPTNETPTIATVSDATKLSSQVFFKDAHDGDRFFVYNKSQKAVLYRPSTNMIINVQTIQPVSASKAAPNTTH
jgi:cytoskeletal protein RodZ